MAEALPRLRRRRLLLLCAGASTIGVIILLIAYVDTRGHWWALSYALGSRPDGTQRCFSVINMPRGVFVTSSLGHTLGFYSHATLSFGRATLTSSGWPDDSDAHEVLGIRWGGYVHRWPEPYPANRTAVRFILVPHIALVILAMILPTWCVVAAYRARGVRIRGICRTCGYDLRATPHQCPECGQPAGEERAETATER